MIYVYLAAPVRPLEGSGETVESNLARAREYYRVLSLAHPDHVFLAPWILNCEVFDETPENIAKGMERNYAVIDLVAAAGDLVLNADGGQLWLCGPRISSNMEKERDYASKRGLILQRIIRPEIEAVYSHPRRCYRRSHCGKPGGHSGDCVQ